MQFNQRGQLAQAIEMLARFLAVEFVEGELSGLV
jgi:hypothetical protein